MLFPETLATWKRFEERFGLEIEVIDAVEPGAPWTRENCCGQAKVDGLDQALDGVEAWITGHPPRAITDTRRRAKLERDEKRGIWKLNPLADWTNKDIWSYIFKHDLPYNPLHDHGLRFDRLRAVHAPRQRPRRPLGGRGQDRVRYPSLVSRDQTP